MSKKLLVIESCIDCPNREVDEDRREAWCNADQQYRKVDCRQPIPSWCPLPDAETPTMRGMLKSAIERMTRNNKETA